MFEIGNSLRDARLRKELDFPELEQGTKIRAKYLRALEDETFDQLPGPTYVKGFLRTYADYLGLDGQLYVDEYNVRYGMGEEALERRPRSAPVGPRPRPRKRRRKFESNVVWLALVGIAVITALVIAAWRFGGSSNQQLPLSSPAKVPHRAGGLIIKAKKLHSSLVIVRAGSDSGKQLYQGTLANLS